MKELLINLDARSGKALYEQIYEYIRNDIADGNISRGEKLPSTRFMASSLQVSRSTVELAYEQLVAEGYLTSRPCAGYFACDVRSLYEVQTQHKRDNEVFLQAREREQIRIHFSPFEIDAQHFPTQIWGRIARKVNMLDDTSLLYASESNGNLALREAIVSYLHQARGVKCESEQIVVGAGNEYLLLLLSQILGDNKVVAMEQYTYPQAYHTFANMKYQVCAVDIDGDGISMEDVRELSPDIVYAMPSHQFPLGIVMPMKRRLELLQWATQGEERYIIEDDHDSEFRYKGKPIPSLQGSAKSQQVIYMGTFSKSIAPFVRVSYMVLPQKLLKRYYEKCGFYATTVPSTQQAVLTQFLAEGYFGRNLNRMRNVYRTKQEYIVHELKKQPWVERVYGENAGMHVLVQVKSTHTEAQICQQALAQQIKLYGLEEYSIAREHRTQTAPTLILGYGNLTEAQIHEGIGILGEIITA